MAIPAMTAETTETAARADAPEVGVVVVTHRAATLLPRSLPPVLEAPIPKRVLVVNSSSGDGTVEVARELGAETLVLPRNQFNHGATREIARRHLGTAVVVMMTPDAVATGPMVLPRLVAPILSGRAAVSYARQIPRQGAGVIESFGRQFNYPPRSEIRDPSRISSLGAYSFFCSNSFAAWSSGALDEVGGFPTVLTNEDAICAARMMRRGYSIAYVADAVVEHSHAYSIMDEFRRSFDAGYERSRHRQLLFAEAGDEGTGRRYFAQILRHVIRHKPYLVPVVVANMAARYAGYKIGVRSRCMPARIAALMSSQDYYWNFNE
jgi:rhamnosyltransferase